MKSPSKEDNDDKIKSTSNDVVQSVNNALDHSVNTLPESTLADIARVRALALNSKNVRMSSQKSIVDTIIACLFNPMFKIGVPVAAAITIFISVNYVSVEAIPELPLAMMAANIPTEDFAMLEDLEFITWLAKNEQSTLL
jgi:hypothetical protein